MPKVIFVNEKQEIEVPAGSVLRTEALKAGIPIHASIEAYLNCRGFGLCGTCKVLVKKGMENLGQPTMMETINTRAHPLTMMARIGHEDELRLACQVVVNGDCTVETQPQLNWTGENFWQKPYPNK
jgi:ferredoxin